MDDQNERRLQLKRDFGDFLDQDHGHGKYPARIKTALSHANITTGKLRLDVDVHDLREHSLPLLQSLLQDPSECINPFEEALDEFVRAKFPKTLLESQQVPISATLHLTNSQHELTLSQQVTERCLWRSCMSPSWATLAPAQCRPATSPPPASAGSSTWRALSPSAPSCGPRS